LATQDLNKYQTQLLYKIKLKDACLRLQHNPDFKKLVKEGFINGFSQIAVLESDHQIPDVQTWLKIKAPYVLLDYLDSIMIEGQQAQEELDDLKKLESTLDYTSH